MASFDGKQSGLTHHIRIGIEQLVAQGLIFFHVPEMTHENGIQLARYTKGLVDRSFLRDTLCK